MNHDYAHCLDYEKGKCPKKCFRAILTEDLYENKIDDPVAWTHFKGTQYCKMDEGKNDGTENI